MESVGHHANLDTDHCPIEVLLVNGYDMNEFFVLTICLRVACIDVDSVECAKDIDIDVICTQLEPSNIASFYDFFKIHL